MASFALSATTGGARKHAWTKIIKKFAVLNNVVGPGGHGQIAEVSEKQCMEGHERRKKENCHGWRTQAVLSKIY